MSCKFFSLSTYDYIRNTCLHQIDERELVTYLSVLQLLHDESHLSYSSITDPLPTSLLLLVLATLLCLGLSLATKGIGPLCCTVATFVTCCLLRIISPHNHLLPTISVPADFTLLTTTCQILPLLVGFDTLTYRKDYNLFPILVCQQDSFLAPLPVSEAPLVSGTC